MGTFFGWVLVVILLALTLGTTLRAFIATLVVWAVEFALNMYFLPVSLFQAFFVIWGVLVLLGIISAVFRGIHVSFKSE